MLEIPESEAITIMSASHRFSRRKNNVINCTMCTYNGQAHKMRYIIEECSSKTCLDVGNLEESGKCSKWRKILICLETNLHCIYTVGEHLSTESDVRTYLMTPKIKTKLDELITQGYKPQRARQVLMKDLSLREDEMQA